MHSKSWRLKTVDFAPAPHITLGLSYFIPPKASAHFRGTGAKFSFLEYIWYIMFVIVNRIWRFSPFLFLFSHSLPTIFFLRFLFLWLGYALDMMMLWAAVKSLHQMILWSLFLEVLCCYIFLTVFRVKCPKYNLLSHDQFICGHWPKTNKLDLISGC